MDDFVVITLFRHGLTEENKKHAYLGWTNSPLCREGLEELRKFCYKSIRYDLVISSDLVRALQTANVMFPNRQVDTMFEFREMNFGIFEGKTYEQLKINSNYLEWLDNAFTVKPPQGESFLEFTRRIDTGWQKIIKRMGEDPKSIVMITHGGVIRYLLTRFAPEKREFWDWQVPHGKGYQLVWEESEDFRRGEKCTLLQVVPLTEKEIGY